MDTLRNTAGELIHAVIRVESRAVNESWNKLFVFESRYSLEIANNGSYWINSPDETKSLIRKELNRRKKLVESVEEVEHAILIF